MKNFFIDGKPFSIRGDVDDLKPCRPEGKPEIRTPGIVVEADDTGFLMRQTGLGETLDMAVAEKHIVIAVVTEPQILGFVVIQTEVGTAENIESPCGSGEAGAFSQNEFTGILKRVNSRISVS